MRSGDSGTVNVRPAANRGRRVRRIVRRWVPQALINLKRRRAESQALARAPRRACDTSNLATTLPQLRDTPEWPRIAEAVAFGPSRASAVNPGDQRVVYSLARTLAPTSVLEIGTNVGGSTVMFAAAVRDAGHVTTVDIVDVNGPEGPARTVGCETPEELLRRCQLENVTFVTSRSTEFMRHCNERFDLIFLDGAHEADVVYEEVPLACSLLKPGGLILLHDMFPDLRPLWSDGKVIPGPWLAIERLRREGAALQVTPLGELPWTTKQGSRRTSLAILTRPQSR